MGRKFWAIAVAYIVLMTLLFGLCMVFIAKLVKELPAATGKLAAEVQTAYEKEKAAQGANP